MMIPPSDFPLVPQGQQMLSVADGGELNPKRHERIRQRYPVLDGLETIWFHLVNLSVANALGEGAGVPLRVRIEIP
jgi:hypothetical protein